MNTINKVVVTSNHPNNKDIFTTKLGNKRFDVNISTGCVWESMRFNKRTGGFRNVIIQNNALKNYIIQAVKSYLN